MPLRTNSSPKVSLRTALVASFVIQIAVAVGATGWLSFRNGQKSVNELMNRISDRVTGHVKTHIQTFADTPYQFLQLNLAAFHTGNLDIADYESMMQYFDQQTQISEAVPFVYFGNPDGDFAGVRQEIDGSTTYWLRDQETAPLRKIYEVNPQRTAKALLRESDYDPRERPWYKSAVAAGNASWSPVYVFAASPQLGITHTAPIYGTLDSDRLSRGNSGRNRSEALLGVLAIDLTLADISNFLRQIEVSESGQVFIIERSGEIIASSASEAPFVRTETEEIRLAAVDSEDILIREAAKRLLDRVGGFAQIQTAAHHTFDIDGRRHLVQVTPIQDGHGLDWLMAVVIPRADFAAQIDANTRHTITLCLIALGIAGLLGVITSRWITEPVVRVARASDQLAQGDLTQQVPPSIITDTDILARSFNQMARQLKKSFDALRESEATNGAIVSSIPDLMIRAHRDGTYLNILGSDRLRGIHGVQHFSPGSTVHESLPPDLAALRLSHIEHALSTGELHVYEQQLTLNGQSQDEEVRILVLGKDEVLIMVRDITARKQAQQALAQSNQDLEQKVAERTASLAKSNQELRKTLYQLEVTQAELKRAKEKAESASLAKSDFLANMSHELRTPLNSIIGFTQLLGKDTSLAPQQRQRLNIVNRSGEHLLSLINQILEMSKIEAGQISLSNNPCNFYALLQDMQDMFCLKVTTKGIRFILESDPDLPQYIRADENKLRQILINLISNAVKFTEQGSVTLRAAVAPLAQQSDPDVSHSLQLEVADTGPGISPEELHKLFVPFEQTETGRRIKQGTGLGLSLSHKFVTIMGGNITPQSIVGEGTCFRVSIPIGVTTSNALPVSRRRGKVTGLAPNQPKYRLLVVDDVTDSRLLLQDLLMSAGLTVRQASNGLEAIDLWQGWHPHLIWMDLRMPEMDGYEAAKEIKRQEAALDATPSTKIIALTASAFRGNQESSLMSDFDDYMLKPFRQDQIWEKLNQHLGIEFIYQNKRDSSIEYPPRRTCQEAAPAISVKDISTGMRSMPEQWQLALHQAASTLKGKQVAHLIEEIPSEQAAIAAHLQTLAENYQFKEIVQLLDSD